MDYTGELELLMLTVLSLPPGNLIAASSPRTCRPYVASKRHPQQSTSKCPGCFTHRIRHHAIPIIYNHTSTHRHNIATSSTTSLSQQPSKKLSCARTTTIAHMLHAPLTFTTAKLDISLLLKSSSPSPPSTPPPPASIRPPLSRPASVPASSLNFPPPSSQRTSPSSSISAAASLPVDCTPSGPSGLSGLSGPLALSQSYSQPSNYPQQLTFPQPQRAYLPPLVSTSPYHVSQSSPRDVAHPPPHHPPAKRPPPTQSHPSASPAKKQSKWTPEEDALIIDLRGSGMKWEDISKRLPGRSAISCRLHYQNYLERRSEWDEERKNRLARLYERLKPEMWGPLAAELGIPWRAAEAMHWQLGEADMARRAGVIPFSLAATPGASALPSGAMPPGGLPHSAGGVSRYGPEEGRAVQGYGTERAGLRAGLVGHVDSLGRLSRHSGDPGTRDTQSPGGRGGGMGGAEIAGEIVLPSVAEMERGLTAFAGGQAGSSAIAPGPELKPGYGHGHARDPGPGPGMGRGGYLEEERKREER